MKTILLIAFVTFTLASTNTTNTTSTNTTNSTIVKPGRFDLQEITVNGKKYNTTAPNKVPLWRRLAKNDTTSVATVTVSGDQLKQKEINETHAKLQKETDEKFQKLVKGNLKYLGDVEKFNVKHAGKNVTNMTNSTKVPTITLDNLKVDNTTVDLDVPRRYRNSKCKPVVKKVYLKKEKKEPKEVTVDVLEERSRRKKAKKLISMADNFIHNADDQTFEMKL
ncbi:Uncharacterized protein QTN25_009897 [Entamoeba marina]